MLLFPQFNPIALQLGPLAIHWYGLAYIAGLLSGLAYAKHLARKHPAPGITADTYDDLFTYAVLGVVLGGRLGYVLFYAPAHFLAHPLDVFKVWQGGMSFHGGALGVVAAIFLFAALRKINPVALADRLTPTVPLGLFFGRLANFINGELVGREAPATLPWSMVFPHIDLLPRHPSQLYEAALEGILLAALLWVATRKKIVHGQPSGLFLAGYAIARYVVEFFRTPEITHSLGAFTITQGQLLCLPMLAAGLYLLALPHLSKRTA